MFQNKQNVFNDFYAAAEYLIDNHYTTSKLLAIRGRSNGGLLMGAAMTQRPDLFGAIWCGFPLVDMLRYQHFLIGRSGPRNTAPQTIPRNSAIFAPIRPTRTSSRERSIRPSCSSRETAILASPRSMPAR